MNKLLLGMTLITSLSIHARTFRLGRQHTEIKFTVPYMSLSSVDGVFKKFDGYFNYDQKSNKLSDIKVKIIAKSIDTNNNKRDSHLRNKDFFNVSKFPEIFFEGTKVNYNTSRIPVSIDGILSIKEKSLPIKLTIVFKGIVSDPFKKTPILYFDLKGKINRQLFDIKWNQKLDNGGLLIGEDVELSAKVESFPVDEYPAFSRLFRKKKALNRKVSIRPALKPKLIFPKKVQSKESETKGKMTLTSDELFRNYALHCLTGFPLFLLCIFIGILTYKKAHQYTQSKVLSFIIECFALALMTYICILLAPWMGYGNHPWL